MSLLGAAYTQILLMKSSVEVGKIVFDSSRVKELG